MSNLTVIIDLLKQASEAIMDVYHNYDSDTSTTWKEDHSPLTLADTRSHQILIEGLKSLTPEIPILSEENSEQIENRMVQPYLWIIDPLDGTKEFVKRKKDFCINVALVNHGEAVEGYVAVPAKNEFYWSQKGKGSFKIDHNGHTQKLNCGIFDKNQQNLKIAASDSHRDTNTDLFIGQFQNPQLFSFGSAIKFLKIAEGEIDIYPRLAPTMEWDTAAPQLILEEAGGKVLDYKTLKKLKYNKEQLLNPHFVAFGKGDLQW